MTVEAGPAARLSDSPPPGVANVARLLPASAVTAGGFRSAGPRFGLVQVTGEAADALRSEHGASPTLTAWGWQWEYQYESLANGPTGLLEFVPILAGLEQGLVIPTVNVLFGIRAPGGFEVAAGPNISPVTAPDEDGDGEREVSAGLGLTFALGYNFRIGEMNLPVNLAYVSNEDGPRYSLTFGWNLRQ